jgi:hypothetical protein
MITALTWVAKLFAIFKLSNTESTTKELKEVSKLPAKQALAATGMIVSRSESGDPSRVARRIIAVSVTAVYLLSLIISAIVMPLSHTDAEYIQSSITNNLKEPFYIILVAYFGAGGIRDLKNGIMGMIK